ncbi:hypothetical protein Ciccas_012008 [Cichlidogyrus casuarinus]|uniref:Serpin domain-containing protein n=1 Tax=Cichlidogyrus casuarinus TaxID=1844966 RepID=A0ABD2PSN2_9PLAT
MDLTKFVGSLYANASCKETNKVLGPASVYSALLLVLAGADGETRAELLNAMGIHSDAGNDAIHAKAFDLFLKDFNKNEADGPELVSANRVYVQKDFAINQTYLNHLKTKYQVEASNVDFGGNAKAVANQANAFVEETTRGKITEIVQPENLNALTVLLLINAMYFKGLWNEMFEERFTEDEEFHRIGSSAVKVPFMKDTSERKIGFQRFADFQVLYLPFKNTGIKMAIVLPDEKGGLIKMTENLFSGDYKDFQEILNHSTDWAGHEYILHLPKFEISSTFDLNETLSKMGVKLAFLKGQADLSRINANGARNLFISKVLHKAYLKADEKGAEAAAVTACDVQIECAMISPPRIITVDHPFLVVIINEQKVPLFIGEVRDPSAKN